MAWHGITIRIIDDLVGVEGVEINSIDACYDGDKFTKEEAAARTIETFLEERDDISFSVEDDRYRAYKDTRDGTIFFDKEE